MVFLNRVRINSQHVNSLLWVIINGTGMLLANMNWLGLFIINPAQNSPFTFVYILLLIPLLSGLIFGGFQFLYAKKNHIPFINIRWVLLTAFGVFILYSVNSLNIWGGYILKLNSILGFHTLSGLISPFTGTASCAQIDKFYIEIMIVSLHSIMMGLTSGLILGICQSILLYKDMDLAKMWFSSVLLSVSISFLINSISYESVSYVFGKCLISQLTPLAGGISGLIYGVSTLKIVKKLL